MTISFVETKKVMNKKKNSKVSSTTKDEASKKPQMNQISVKLFQGIIDFIQDRGDDASDESRKLGLMFKQAFLNVSSNGLQILSGLIPRMI